MTLVDRNDYHQFQPLLYQVATSQLPARDIARPHRTIFQSHPTVEVVTRRRRRGLPRRPSLRLCRRSDRHRVAPGDGGGRAGPTSSASPERPARLPALLRGGRRTSPTPPAGPDTRSRIGRHGSDGTLDVVVVGGGPTGVETTGALVELMHPWQATAQTPYPGRISWSTAETHCWAHSPTRPTLRPRQAHGRRARSASGSAWQPCTPTGRAQRRQTLPARTVVWGGGESAALIAERTGSSPGRGGRIDVLPDLSVDGFPGVYAVGDVANIPAATARCPSSARSPSSPGVGRPEHPARPRRRARRSPSTTRTRASWR